MSALARAVEKQLPVILWAGLAAALLLGFWTGHLVFKEQRTPRGDVNTDGRVNAVDLTMMKRHLLGIYDLTSSQIRIGDLNRNGRIDQQDIDAAGAFIIGGTGK
jgi:hypothetical protein